MLARACTAAAVLVFLVGRSADATSRQGVPAGAPRPRGVRGGFAFMAVTQLLCTPKRFGSRRPMVCVCVYV